MAPESFDPFAVDEAAPDDPAETFPTAPAAPAAPVDPFAPKGDAVEAAAVATQPATPVVKVYTVVHHKDHGYGLVLAAGQLPGIAGNRNAVVVGWFESVSDPLTTDQLEPVTSS